LSRLTAASTVTGGSTTSYGYGYDPAGNRTSSTKTGTAQQYYAYNPADELCVTGTVSVSSPTGACPTSAPAGDTVSGYDGNGNLTAAALPAGASTLAYNSKNQTVSSSTAGTTSSYGYAGASQVDRTYAGPVGHSTSLLGTEGRVTNGPTYAWVTRTPDGQPIDIRQGSGPSYTPYYYLLDQQGTVLALTQNGAYSDSATYTYDPYGQTLTATSTGTTPGLNPLRYATGTLDPSTGLTKLGLRYYNPNQGRFTQTDPTRRDQLTYAYVGDNAQNYIDPSGAFSFGSALAGIALTAAVVAVVVIAAPETLAAGAVYVVAVDTGLASGAYDIGCAVKRGGC